MARPRQFDEAEVLDRAMQVFCAHGYEGASMAALTAAMGLAGPSVYAAFGSKRGLFEAVLDRHITCEDEQSERILSAPTARDVAERWLFEAAERLPGTTPTGSVLILGGLSAGPDNRDVPAALARRRQANELALWDRLERAQADGDLPPDADQAAQAAFVSAVCDGMVIRAAAGGTATDLRKIADQAMKAWVELVTRERLFRKRPFGGRVMVSAGCVQPLAAHPIGRSGRDRSAMSECDRMVM